MATSQQQVQTHRHICSIVTQTRPTATIPQQRRKRKWQCIFFSSVSSRWNQNPQRHLEIRPEQHGDLMIHVTLQTTPVFTLIMTLWPLTWTPHLSDHVPSVLLWFWFSIVQQVSSASWAWSGFYPLTSSGSHTQCDVKGRSCPAHCSDWVIDPRTAHFSSSVFSVFWSDLTAALKRNKLH